LCTGQRLLHRRWDDEFVVFNDLTGDCHLLDGGSFAVLCFLQHRGGAATAELALSLAAEFDDIDPTDLGYIEHTLAELAGCDLVEVLP
jgi:PqqD family protein of HPr-rel-A system